MTIAKALRQFARTSHGSVTVEFIATLPLLLVTLAFSFEFGYALWAYDTAARDVRAAARYLARACSSGGYPCTLGSADTNSALNIAMRGSPFDSNTANNHFPWNLPSTTINFTTALRTFTSSLYRQNGGVIQAQASVPLSLPMLGYLSILGVPTAYTLVVNGQARHNDIGD